MLDLADRDGEFDPLVRAQREFSVEAIIELKIVCEVVDASCERQIDLTGIAKVQNEEIRRTPIRIGLLKRDSRIGRSTSVTRSALPHGAAAEPLEGTNSMLASRPVTK